MPKLFAEHKVDKNIEKAWKSEIARRILEIENGKVKLIPQREVMARLRKTIGGTSK